MFRPTPPQRIPTVRDTAIKLLAVRRIDEQLCLCSVALSELPETILHGCRLHLPIQIEDRYWLLCLIGEKTIPICQGYCTGKAKEGFADTTIRKDHVD